MAEKRVEIRERWYEYMERGMQMDNKPPFRPPSTNGISPVTPVLLVYAACISGVSHQERNVRRFLFPEESCGSRPSSSLPLVPFYTALDGIKEIPPRITSFPISFSISLSFPFRADDVGEFS